MSMRFSIRRRRDGFGGCFDGNFRNLDALVCSCNNQAEMKYWAGVGLNNHILLHLLEALRRHGDGVIADGNGGKLKFPVVVGI